VTREEIKAAIRSNILLKMQAEGVSQAMLAERIGSERRVVNRQLNINSTSIDKLLEFAEALEIDVKIIF
jgi:predicted XRE-type DNA-binding protein